MQGNVVGIVNDATGEQVAAYSYDAWGNITSITGIAASTIGQYNSMRYRGYYYDTETGMYYLQSRYYNPEMRRFINADDVQYITSCNDPLSKNIYIYCTNSSPNLIDETGYCYRNSNGKVYHDKWEYPETYNRKKAIDYAKKWYNSYNPYYYRYSNDCANFVSQCLRAGGIFMSDNWKSFRLQKTFLGDFKSLFKSCLEYNWDVSPAWRLVDKQYSYFKQNYTNKQAIEIRKKSDISNKIAGKNVRKGDLLYFVEKNNNKETVYHATIVSKVTDKIYFSGHTNSRYNEELSKAWPKKCVAVFILRIKL